MSYGPPPVPRKPASYSPTFLARSTQYHFDDHHDYDRHHRQSDGRYNETIEDEYDRDFALDAQFQDLPRSRPSSHGSAYGRPLPSPPGGRPDPIALQMPSPGRHGSYESMLDMDDDRPYIEEAHLMKSRTSRHVLPHSHSQSSISSNRPLPEPPLRGRDVLMKSLRLPTPPPQHILDISLKRPETLHTIPTAPLNPFQTPPDERHRHRNFVLDGSSSYRSHDGPWRHDFRHRSWDDTRDTHFNEYDAHIPSNYPESSFDGDMTYASPPQHHAAAAHARHISHEVSTLAINPVDYTHRHMPEFDPAIPANRYVDDSILSGSQPFSEQGYTSYQEMPRHGRRSSEASFDSMDSPEHEYVSSYFPDAPSSIPWHDQVTLDPPAPYPAQHYKDPDLFGYDRSTLQSHEAEQQSTSRTRFHDRPPIPDVSHILRESALPDLPSSRKLDSDSLETSLSMKPASVYRQNTLQLAHSAPLPEVPKTKARIAALNFELCTEPWSRCALYTWTRDEGLDAVASFITSVGDLFRHFVPALPSYMARKIASDLLDSYLFSGEILKSSDEPEVLKYEASAATAGVLPMMTGKGCYSARCHAEISNHQCYAPRCSRTAHDTQASQQSSLSVDAHDWAQFWNLTSDIEPLVSLSKQEIQRQYHLHEVIYSEREYSTDLTILRDVFQNSFTMKNPKDQELANLVFGLIPALTDFCESLESALHSRQGLQGPVIHSIGDIFHEWIERARVTYIDYASKLMYASRAIRSRRQNDPQVRSWLTKCEQDPRLKKLDFSSYQGAPTRRIQRYALLLGDVLRKTPPEYPDHKTLSHAIERIKLICQECDMQVKIAQDKISLLDLEEQLMWKTPKRDLGLMEPSRQIRHRGELQRKSESLTSWQTRDVILLDNYLISIKRKEGNRAMISRTPIPINYLLVEDYTEILYKSSTRILGGTMTHALSPGDTMPRRATMDGDRATRPGVAGSPGKSTAENIYPFTVRHAGKPDEKTTFYAESAPARSAWVRAIVEAKSARWSTLCNREPFSVNIITDQAFGRFTATSGQVEAAAGPSNAVEAALEHRPTSGGKALTMSRVQCSTIFRRSDNVEVYLIGTDDGVYANSDGVWSKLVTLARVSQIAVLQAFGVLTVLADKILIAYTLDDLMHTKDVRSSRVIRKPPQRLSGSKDVGFFEVGKMKDRMLVIYKKRENGNSVFKALEPVIGKKQEKAAFFKKGSGTDFFRDFDQFFIPAECYGMQYLRTTICIKCSRGFEIMSLDSKQPLTIPNLQSTNTTSLRNRIENMKPLGTYRVQEGEFLCCYTECGLFVDKYGSVSRPYTLEWQGRPTHAVLVGAYVLVIGKDFIEVWNVEKRSLRQVITGHDIRLLAHSSAGSDIDVSRRGVVIAMTCPGNSNKQLVFEMILQR